MQPTQNRRKFTIATALFGLLATGAIFELGCSGLAGSGHFPLIHQLVKTNSNEAIILARLPCGETFQGVDSTQLVGGPLEPLANAHSQVKNPKVGNRILEVDPGETLADKNAGRDFDMRNWPQIDLPSTNNSDQSEATMLTPIFTELTPAELRRHYWGQLKNDYDCFYRPRNLANLAAGFALGGALANTNADSFISHDLFYENIVSTPNDEIREELHRPKSFGDGYFVLPLIGVAAASQPWLDDFPAWSPIGDWGNLSLRTILVGGPFVLVAQRLTGASRPNESPSRSHWEPFQDNNGVSGHAFVGAVPFLAAANMTDRHILKALCYVGSIMPGISRINDERHYFSQVFLGWYVAFMASQAVNQTQTGTSGFQLLPTFDQNGLGFILDKRF